MDEDNQLWNGINALIEAMKFALKGDSVSARHYIGSASASLAGTGSEDDAAVAGAEASASRYGGGLAPWQVRRLKVYVLESAE